MLFERRRPGIPTLSPIGTMILATQHYLSDLFIKGLQLPSILIGTRLISGSGEQLLCMFSYVMFSQLFENSGDVLFFGRAISNRQPPDWRLVQPALQPSKQLIHVNIQRYPQMIRLGWMMNPQSRHPKKRNSPSSHSVNKAVRCSCRQGRLLSMAFLKYLHHIGSIQEPLNAMCLCPCAGNGLTRGFICVNTQYNGITPML